MTPMPPPSSAACPGRFRRRRSALAVLALWAPFAALAMPASQPSQPSQRVVLVAAAESPITCVTPEDARKLYLGMPVTVDGRSLRPLRNGVDPRATEVFMQRVMFMSAEAYERQLQSGAAYGASRPAVVASWEGLLAALAHDLLAITYMSRELAQATSGLRIVGEP